MRAEEHADAVRRRITSAQEARGKHPKEPWVQLPSGEFLNFGHLPTIWSSAAMLLHGRSGSALGGFLQSSQPFQSWKVDERYLDGTSVTARRAAAHQILVLHQQALTAGVLP